MKKAILVVSFGTTYLQSKIRSIDATAEYIQNRFKDYDVFQAYTSVIIRKKLTEKGVHIDDVKTALDNIKSMGYTHVIIVSLHLIAGSEYEKKIISVFNKYVSSFNQISLTKPMLYEDRDYKKISDIIKNIYKDVEKPLIFMGHGSCHKNDASYEKLQKELDKKNKGSYYIATVEGKRTISDIINELKNNNIKKVSLTPLMMVCGDHANNDMAGDEEDSWINLLKKEKIEVDIILKGLGEYSLIKEFFISRLEEKMS